MILLLQSCQTTKKQESLKVEITPIDIEFPDFPVVERVVQKSERYVEFYYQDVIGLVPISFFYALAEYKNSIDAIETYIEVLNREENLPP